MLKNKMIVKKIRNIVILLMAIIIMFGAYKNIDRSRAEDVIEIGAIAIDNYGYLENESFILEAQQIEDDIYEIELPESVNGKKINQIIKVTLEDIVPEVITENAVIENASTENETTETPEDQTTILPEQEEQTEQQPEPEAEPKQETQTEVEQQLEAEQQESEGIEVIENKIQIQLSKEELDSKQINIEVVYDVAILEKNEEGTYQKNLLVEKTEEERQLIEITEETEMLYSKILRYEDEENNKLVELRGYLPIDAELQVEEVTQEKITEIFGETKINVAYDIKIIRKIVTQVPVDEANPESEIEEIVEIIEINPEEFAEKCGVTITDANIAEKSQVYHVKEDNTYEKVNVNESTKGNVNFEAQTFSIYAVGEEIVPDEGIETGADPGKVSIRYSLDGGSTYTAWQENVSITVPMPESGKVVVQVKCGNSVEICINGDCKNHHYTGIGGTYTHTITTARSYKYYGYNYDGGHHSANVTETSDITIIPSVTTGFCFGDGAQYIADTTADATGAWTNKNVYARRKGRVDPTCPASGFTTQISQNNSTWANYSFNNTNALYVMSTEGTHKRYFRATNGRVNTKTVTLTARIDKTNPTGTISSNRGEYTNQSTITVYVTASDALSGIKSVAINGWYGTGWVTYHTVGTVNYDSTNNRYYATFTFNNIKDTTTGNTSNGDGNYTFDAHVTDNAGNTFATNGITVLYDTTAPTMSIPYNIETAGLIRNFDAYNNTGSGHSTSATIWKDLTGTNDGTVKGGTWGADFLTLDGVDDWVNLGQANITNAVTLEAAIVPVAIQSGATIISNYNSGGVELQLVDGIPRLVFARGDTGANYTLTSNTTLVAGTKYHIVATYDGTTAKIYINGALKNSGSISTNIKPTVGAPFALGCNPSASDTPDNYLANIKIYSARIYNKALTQAQITNNRNNLVNTLENNLTWAKSHSVTVKLSDALSGIASGASIKYGWSTSRTTAPGTYTTATLSYTAGATSTTFTATGSGLTGKYYLWVVPTTYKDRAGNSQTTNFISTRQFLFDNTPPEIVMPDVEKYGLLGSYEANNNTGTGHSNSATTWKNLATEGTVNGGTWGADFLTLDGVDDWVNIGQASITNAVTLEATIVPVAIQSGNAAIISNYHSGGVELQLSEGIPRLVFARGDTGANYILTSNTTLVAGTKYHIVATYDGTTAKIYINGALKNSGSISTNIKPTAGAPFALGCNPSATETPDGNYANIKIYSARIYNKALTQAQIQSNKAATSPTGVVTDGLIRNFDGNNNTGNGHSSVTKVWRNLASTVGGTVNGGTWTDDYLTLDGVDDWVNLGQVSLTNAVTLEAAIEVNEIKSGLVQIISNQQGGGIGLGLLNGVPEISVYVSEEGAYKTARSNETLVVGQKYHITGTYDGTTIKIYVDGVLKAEIAVTGTIGSPTNNTVLAIGANPDGTSANGEFANMNVYSARIYNTALTQAQISNNISIDEDKTWAKSHSATVTLKDLHSGLATGNSVKYGWSLSEMTPPESYTTVTISNTAGAGSATFTATGSDLRGKYYLWVVPETLNDVVGNSNTTSAVSVGQYYFDDIAPYWTVGTPTIDTTNKKVTVEITGTDDHSGYASDTLDISDIVIYIDGEYSNVTKTLSEATLTSDGVKYTLTLSNFEEALRRSGKLYKEWSGNVTIKIAADTLTDRAGNVNVENNLDVDFVDFIKPEITYQYSNADIDYDEKTVQIVFSVTDKYFNQSTLAIGDLIIKIDGEDISDVSTVTKTLTQSATPLTETRTKSDGTTETATIGYTYTLLLEELEQDAIASGEKYLDYSGVVTVEIPEGKISDTSNNTNNAEMITLGISKPAGNEVSPEYIPDGYKYKEGSLSEGFVVTDDLGNEFVWVEVPKTLTVYPTAGLAITEFTDAEYAKIEADLHTYTTTYRNGTTYTDTWSSQEATGLTEKEYNAQKKKMLKSIYKYGGFYVGRYETGIEYKNGHRTAAGDATQTPVIKQNAYPYNCVTSSQAQILSTTFAKGQYTSSLMFGVQWDLILKYLETKGVAQEELITDSTQWGNYSNNPYNITNTEARYSINATTWFAGRCEQTVERGTLLSTGASDSFSKQNIYDLAGNEIEYTLEWTHDLEVSNVVRGGGAYAYGGDEMPASYRLDAAPDRGSVPLIGFRVALYKDDDPTTTPNDAPTYIPEGYTHVEGTTMENGYVVQDASGNQYVWVEVPRTSEVYSTAGTKIIQFTDTEFDKIENDLNTYTTEYKRNNICWAR